MMSRFFLVGLWIIPTVSFCQSIVTDSLLFSLIHRSIQNEESSEINVYYNIIQPGLLINDDWILVRNSEAFSEEDVAYAKQQLKNPVYLTWDDFGKFFKDINIIRSTSKSDLFSIAYPILSLDKKTILIYWVHTVKVRKQEIISAMLCQWYNSPNGWILERQQVVANN